MNVSLNVSLSPDSTFCLDCFARIPAQRAVVHDKAVSVQVDSFGSIFSSDDNLELVLRIIESGGNLLFLFRSVVNLSVYDFYG